VYNALKENEVYKTIKSKNFTPKEKT